MCPWDALPTNRTWPPPCRHGTYQHKAITSRSRQLLMMGTWLPETCWATIRREIKNTKSDIYLVFLIHTELRCTVNHTSEEVITYLTDSDRSQCCAVCGLGLSATILLRLRVWIPHRAWMPFSCECCVFSRRSLSDGPICRTEETYRVCMCHCVWSDVSLTLDTYNELVKSGRDKKERLIT